ncbi:ABC transporter ATP-binding protein [Pelovirga terrestris]|nr:ABC transporter ATP-binding protein [Pelovirga terrestris]
MGQQMTSGTMSLRGVAKYYRNPNGERMAALSPLDLDIAASEFVCLVGPSGCGKTTLINLLAGFDQPSCGSITIDGKPVTKPDSERIMIFQDYGLYPWKSALGNVMFALEAKGVAKSEAKATALHHLEIVGLKDSAERYPHQLSGGMKQRVAIARALAASPQVLFMDEPFAALDAFTRLRLQDELLRIWQEQQPTVVFVTHDLDEAIYLGSKVILMAPYPGRLRKIVDIQLPRPCDRTDSVFAAYRRELFREFQLVHEEAMDYAI